MLLSWAKHLGELLEKRCELWEIVRTQTQRSPAPYNITQKVPCYLHVVLSLQMILIKLLKIKISVSSLANP